MQDITIVPLTKDRIREVTELDSQLFPLDNWSEACFPIDEEQPLTYVALHTVSGKQKVIGYCTFVTIIEGELHRIGTAPGYQRKGVAQQLLNEMFIVGQKKGIEKWFLEVRASNRAAIRFYEKNGFKPVGRRKNYYKAETGREDALVMSKE